MGQCGKIHYPGGDPENGPAEKCLLEDGHGAHSGPSQFVCHECGKQMFPHQGLCSECEGPMEDEINIWHISVPGEFAAGIWPSSATVEFPMPDKDDKEYVELVRDALKEAFVKIWDDKRVSVVTDLELAKREKVDTVPIEEGITPRCKENVR